jgi:hypothetical protein
MRIVRSGFNSKARYEPARILLSCIEADLTAHIVNGQQEALHLAVQLGDAEMCRLLICDGRLDATSALTRDQDGQLAMKNKPWANEEVILQLTACGKGRSLLAICSMF